MKNQPERGYIALISVIIVSTVVLGIAITVSLLAIGQAQSGLATYKAEDTLSFVEGCMEDALIKTQANSLYSGGNITRPEGTCSIVITKSGSIWTITATTTATSYKRTVQAVVNRSSKLLINSWKEI